MKHTHTKDRKLKSVIIMSYNNNNNYTSWSIVILNKLTGFKLVTNFPVFY